ncbi:Last part of transposase in ISC1250 [Saccharolobus solfataricus P2]|uniref:Last part of transposase in ISC1250 n=2 Tax=Saccharolobus solfataricus TaxID=2287 RepID=Q97UZ3_SACS2|nr:Last part of transposase in ISC1250 [Saccharolobus solfataricus P2]SAI86487.1 partial transposase in ISC1250 [Saccharolobus solfataricus]
MCTMLDFFTERFYTGSSQLPRNFGSESNNLIESFNSLLERRFGKFHSPWRMLQIARTIANNYNLLTYFLIIVIILHCTYSSRFIRNIHNNFFIELS